MMFSDDFERHETLCEVIAEDYKLVKCGCDVSAWNAVEADRANITMFVFDETADGFNSSWLITKISDNALFETVPIAFTSIGAFESFTSLGIDTFACDIVSDEMEPEVILQRIKNLIELYTLKHQIANLSQIHSRRLMMQANKLREQTQKMQKLNYDLIELLVAAIESRDVESGQHVKRIRFFVKALLDVVATECPEYNLNEEQVEIISLASAVHDIGKISIPDAIMLKPARLTKEEFELMKAHTVKGAKLISMLDGMDDSVYLQYCYEVCLNHHERWDGKGYPNKLRGDDIPISAQVVSVADCYDALTSERPYKHALSHDEAVNLIKTGACGAFSPQLMKCFDWCLSDFRRIEEEFRSDIPEDDSLRDNILDNSEIATEDFFEFPEENSDATAGVLKSYERMIVDSYDVIFEASFQDDTFTVHKGEWTKYFSYMPKNYLEATVQCFSICHPDDQPGFADNFSIDAFAKLIKEGYRKTRVEFRTRMKDGREAFVRGFLIFVLSDTGEFTGLCGAFNLYNSSSFVVDVKPRFMSHDSVTGLMNAGSIQTEVDRYLIDNPASQGVLIFIDVDDMTALNHKLGYEFGNNLLKLVADKLKAMTGDNHIIAKTGGDKFCVYVKDASKRAEVILFVENMHKNLRKEYIVNGAEHLTTVTMGISRYPDDGNDYRELLSSAEYASETAKLSGNNVYAFYNGAMRGHNLIDESVLTGMESFSEGVTDPCFMPVVDKKSGALICYDYIPFSIPGEMLTMPTELYYEVLSTIKNPKRSSLITLKGVVTKVDELIKAGREVPPVSVYTLFRNEDMPTILQELAELAERAPDACKRVCLNISQDFLDGLTWRKIKAFADAVKEFGFSFGVFLVGDRYFHTLLFTENVFDRMVLTSEFAEKAFTGSYPVEFLAQLTTYLAAYSGTVTIPSSVASSNAMLMFNAGCTGFSDYLSPLSGFEAMLSHYEELATSNNKASIPEHTQFSINPVSFLHQLSVGGCIITQHDLYDNRFMFSDNADSVLGYNVAEYICENVGNYEKLIHPDDVITLNKAMLAAKAVFKNTVCEVRLRTVTDGVASYRPFRLNYVCTPDTNGVPNFVQCLIVPV